MWTCVCVIFLLLLVFFNIGTKEKRREEKRAKEKTKSKKMTLYTTRMVFVIFFFCSKEKEMSVHCGSVSVCRQCMLMFQATRFTLRIHWTEKTKISCLWVPCVCVCLWAFTRNTTLCGNSMETESMCHYYLLVCSHSHTHMHCIYSIDNWVYVLMCFAFVSSIQCMACYIKWLVEFETNKMKIWARQRQNRKKKYNSKATQTMAKMKNKNYFWKKGILLKKKQEIMCVWFLNIYIKYARFF